MNRLLRKILYLSAISTLLVSPDVCGQVKIDINMNGRQPSETNETGYIPWIVASAVSDTLGDTPDEALPDGITIILTSTGTGLLKPNWYKAGIAETAPFAKLFNDGVFVNPDDIPAGSDDVAVEMRIRGLAAGTHTIQTYHNQVDNPASNTFPPVNIFLNGQKVVENMEQSVRATTQNEASKFFSSVDVSAGDDVVVEYRIAPGSAANRKTVIINAIEIDVNQAEKLAANPVPSDCDEHVDADEGSLTLQWSPAADAVSHDVYFGTDAESLKNADKQSSEYKGNQTDTNFYVSALYSMDTYYWRIDEIDAEGVVTKGNVWYFRPRQLAFNGAEGYGRFARGGRGGIVVKVTNLNNSGPGSLRDAIENPEYEGLPRTIIFDVSGRINITDRLSVNKPYITIAGQTAPGKGICVSGHAFGIGGVNDVIIRHIRLRVGAEITTDGMGQSGANHSIIDHASISWSKDEATSSRNAHNHTFQRCLISEPLNRANHQNYPAGSSHGYAASIGGDIGSYHHNLLAHSYGRNWSLAGGLDGNGYYQGKLDIFNNVIYNWGTRTTDGGAHQVNFFNNYYKPGAETSQFYALNAEWDGFPGTQQYYCNGNIVRGRYEDLTNPLNACRSDSKNPDPWVSDPFFPSYAEIHTAKEAYKHVLSDVGATQPVLDDHDKRIIRETIDSSWTYRGSYNAPNGTRGIIDHPDDVGGWEDYGSDVRTTDYDSDNDGLPDWWERIVSKTNTASPAGDFSDSNADPDKDGFTNLDDFLGWMGETHYFTGNVNPFIINLKELSRGFTASPHFTVSDAINCTVTISNDSLASVAYESGATQTGYFKFTVTDSEGGSMTRNINLLLGESPVDNIFVASSAFKVECNNPATKTLTIKISGKTAVGKANIALYDLAGKSVLNKSVLLSDGNMKLDLNVSHFGSAFYFLRVGIGRETQILKIKIL